MARIPLSFYFNILAGIFVVFNHFASSETGDFALNKVTGAAGRFYTLFQEAVVTVHHGCASRLEAALCGPTLGEFLPHDARLHYCHAYPERGGSLDGREPDRGFGSSDFASVYHRPRTRPLDPRTSTEESFWQTRSSRAWPGWKHLSRTVWDWSCEVMVVVGLLLLRTWASWWWFTAPLKVTGILLAAYVVVSAWDCLLGTNVVLRFISQMYMVVVADFLQCIQWVAQCHAWDIGVAAMERICGTVVHACQRT